MNPMRSQNFADFLTRERLALLRRRQLLEPNPLKSYYIPPKKSSLETIDNIQPKISNLQTIDNLLASASEPECKNGTFNSEAELSQAGFELSQCISTTSEVCQENCQCRMMKDKVCENGYADISEGQSCTQEICEQIEEEVCGGQFVDSIPDQVLTNLNILQGGEFKSIQGDAFVLGQGFWLFSRHLVHLEPNIFYYEMNPIYHTTIFKKNF